MTQGKSAARHLRDLREGGALTMAVSEAGQLAEMASQAEMALFVADCDRARNRSAVLRAIAKAVDYPLFFGGDLEALYDCLCDTVTEQKTGVVLWLSHLHSADPALEDDAVNIETVCADVAEFARDNGRAFAYYFEHAGRHAEPDTLPVAASSRDQYDDEEDEDIDFDDSLDEDDDVEDGEVGGDDDDEDEDER